MSKQWDTYLDTNEITTGISVKISGTSEEPLSARPATGDTLAIEFADSTIVRGIVVDSDENNLSVDIESENWTLVFESSEYDSYDFLILFYRISEGA